MQSGSKPQWGQSSKAPHPRHGFPNFIIAIQHSSSGNWVIHECWQRREHEGSINKPLMDKISRTTQRLLEGELIKDLLCLGGLRWRGSLITPDACTSIIQPLVEFAIDERSQGVRHLVNMDGLIYLEIRKVRKMWPYFKYEFTNLVRRYSCSWHFPKGKAILKPASRRQVALTNQSLCFVPKACGTWHFLAISPSKEAQHWQGEAHHEHVHIDESTNIWPQRMALWVCSLALQPRWHC